MSLVIAPMGHINDEVGICGFVSALMAIHDADGLANDAQGGVFAAATLPKRLFREIHACFQAMVDQNEAALIRDVETFTRSFGKEYRKFTVQGYLNSGADNVTPEMLKIEAIRVLLSVAMPPDGLLFFLRTKLGLGAARRVNAGDNAAKYIVGVRDASKTNGEGLHGGLVHWMYVSGGKVYSWGKEYDSVASAGAFTEVCRISVGVH